MIIADETCFVKCNFNKYVYNLCSAAVIFGSMCILFVEASLFDFLCSAEILPWLKFTLRNKIFHYISDSCISQIFRLVHSMIEGILHLIHSLIAANKKLNSLWLFFFDFGCTYICQKVTSLLQSSQILLQVGNLGLI